MTRTLRSQRQLSEIQGRADRLAKWMDEAVPIPGTKIRLGWDNFIGLLPGIGDAASLLSHLILVQQALRVGARKRVYVHMAWNAGVDFLVGLVPVLGDVLDVFWKANRKNANLLRGEIIRQINQTAPRG
ncbi:MAG: DUF4112 domain-containing protein [Pirellulales bacterium]|nr:DUF4112 domain-containing protein [Pirellulales bacterium]